MIQMHKYETNINKQFVFIECKFESPKNEYT